MLFFEKSFGFFMNGLNLKTGVKFDTFLFSTFKQPDSSEKPHQGNDLY